MREHFIRNREAFEKLRADVAGNTQLWGIDRERTYDVNGETVPSAVGLADAEVRRMTNEMSRLGIEGIIVRPQESAETARRDFTGRRIVEMEISTCRLRGSDKGYSVGASQLWSVVENTDEFKNKRHDETRTYARLDGDWYIYHSYGN